MVEHTLDVELVAIGREELGALGRDGSNGVNSHGADEGASRN